ncbi:MAG: ThiF family adenylyltransferase [Nitrososphaeria archaeon]|nr:ThiF family adenylyltransferase [Nitrososphaeria archaeon]
MIITKIIKPMEDSWRYKGSDYLSPTSSFINQAIIEAEKLDSCLIFVHTHPQFTPAWFSNIDKKTNKEMFANISQILDRPLGSLVFSKGEIYGVMYKDRKEQPISNYTISGQLFFEYDKVKPKKLDKKFDRQYNAIGKENNSKLQNMTISIVGVGGTGSALAVQLARMGVKELQIFDHDVISKTNIPRVYGAKDSDCGRPKVDVLKEHITTFSKCKVNVFRNNITKTDLISTLTDSDLIFSCTDNLTSRAVLNDVALQYYIPLIDVGCRIDLDKTKRIFQAIIKIQSVTTNSACLWCTGTLNAKTILQESLTKKEKQRLVREGYYAPIETQPSVVSMTTMAASMGINKLLALLGTFGPEYASLTQIELKDGFMIEENPKILENCICHKRKGLGDKRRLILG